LSIRLALPDDGPALAEIYAPAVTERATSFELEAPDGAEMWRRAGDVLVRTPWIVYVTEDRIAGYAYAGTHRPRPAYGWSVEVSAYVHPSYQRAGIGRALYTSLLAVVALQGFRSAYAGVTLPNPASVGFHQSLGFTFLGTFHNIGYKLGAWHDVMWLERALAPYVRDPPPPTPLPDIVTTAEFAHALAAGTRTPP
jgi:L-amino acid N-acyltransferase YncA